jgi:hypothetical protein
MKEIRGLPFETKTGKKKHDIRMSLDMLRYKYYSLCPFLGVAIVFMVVRLS